MRRQQVFSFSESWRKGQSLIELTLVLTLLLTLLTGMVEFGNLLNQYITVVDAAREGARFASNDDPFIRATTPFGIRTDFFTNVDQIVEGTFLANGTRDPKSKGALSPIRLRPDMGDDVVVSFFSIHNGVPKRFPEGTAYEHGWSYYRDYYTFKGWTPFPGQESAFSTSDMAARMNTLDPAPDTGMVLVEVYYNYDQILKLWSFIGIPNPIRVHAYSIMPLSAGEPTK